MAKLTRQAIFEHLKKVLKDQLGLANNVEITEDMLIVEDKKKGGPHLSADSLDVLELKMEVEEQLDITISDKDADKFRTVGDLLNYLDEHQPDEGYQLPAEKASSEVAADDGEKPAEESALEEPSAEAGAEAA